MKSKKIIGIIVATAIVLSGCNSGKTVPTGSGSAETSQTAEKIVFTDSEPETEPSATETKGRFEFNPHVHSDHLAKTVDQDKWDALYNLCDALRAGENTFKCASQEAYNWATDLTVLCCTFPAAGLQIDAKSSDGSPAFENGTGKITYRTSVEEWLKREQAFEEQIEEIINSTVETDDTDFEKALKLYLYIANNYTYEYDIVEDDNYIYKTFKRKTGQCVNFSSAYAYLLLQAGVDAEGVGTGEGMNHAWTYVTINGKGYHIDTTWALKSERPGTEYILLDYFLMSDEERNNDGCYVSGLTVDILPGYWASRTTVPYTATDNKYNLRYSCGFVSLDEENKVLHYVDQDGNKCELKYDI